jgi:hypothetical protein
VGLMRYGKRTAARWNDAEKPAGPGHA